MPSSRQADSGTRSRATLARCGIRIAMDVSWWERLIERTGRAERWEAQDNTGRWRKYWRRYGSLPRWLR